MLSRSLVDRTVEVLRSVHGMQASLHSVPGKAHAMMQARMEQQLQLACMGAQVPIHAWLYPPCAQHHCRALRRCGS